MFSYDFNVALFLGFLLAFIGNKISDNNSRMAEEGIFMYYIFPSLFKFYSKLIKVY